MTSTRSHIAIGSVVLLPETPGSREAVLFRSETWHLALALRSSRGGVVHGRPSLHSDARSHEKP